MPTWDGVSENIGEIQALKRQESPQSAQEILEKVYRYVLPIMRSRKLRVHKLVEFLPKDANLLGLNVNHGQRISLRLRYAHDPTQLLPFESVLGTMLHELCHNNFGPHDSQFFGLLDEYTNEMEDLMARGFRGDKFLGKGNVLGCRPLQKGSRPKNLSGLARGPGYRLGGTRSAKTIRELAYQAAERRALADRRCANTHVPRFDELGFEEISKEEFEQMLSAKRKSPSPCPIPDNGSQTKKRRIDSLPEVIDLTGESD